MYLSKKSIVEKMKKIFIRTILISSFCMYQFGHCASNNIEIKNVVGIFTQFGRAKNTDFMRNVENAIMDRICSDYFVSLYTNATQENPYDTFQTTQADEDSFRTQASVFSYLYRQCLLSCECPPPFAHPPSLLQPPPDTANDFKGDRFNNGTDIKKTSSGVRKKEGEVEDEIERQEIRNSRNSSTGQCKLVLPEKLGIRLCLTLSGESIDCNAFGLFESNTRVLFDCDFSLYIRIDEPKYTEITCKEGKWDPPPPLNGDFCEAKCGTSEFDVYIPPIPNFPVGRGGGGDYTDIWQYPWHAGIYEFNKKNNEHGYICGGTLISSKVIITAAHCVSVENAAERTIDLKNFSTLIVTLGKGYRDLTSTEDRLAQIHEIADIKIPLEYDGRWARYADDIAFVMLKEKAKFNWHVHSVCIDLKDENFEKEQLTKDTEANMISLGLNKDGVLNERIVVMKMFYVPRNECIKKIDFTWRDYLSKDKLCTELKHDKYYICEGDSGGGLVFRDPKRKRHYLRGVLSAGSNECKDEKGFALFTRLSSYKDLVEKYMQLE